MLENELVILIARSNNLSDAVKLDQVVADLESLKSDVLDETFSNGQSSLSAQVASTHAQMTQCLAVCEDRTQSFGEVEER